ncbi:hypothetical protein AAMO2058_001213000, partial [Amorphochlora amoebiformis]
MSSKAAIKAGGVTRVPMPQPNGLPVSVKCSKCGKWRRFFSLNNGPAAVRNESHMWTCEMSPDPERKTCQVEEEVAVGIQIPEDPNGPWKFDKLGIPIFNKALYDKYYSYNEWSLEETLALLRYVLRNKLEWGNLPADPILTLRHSDPESCEMRYLHFSAMTKLYNLEDIILKKADLSFVKAQEVKYAQAHNDSEAKRLKRQKNSRSANAKTSTKRRKQKLNVVYCKDTDSDTKKRQGRGGRSRRKKKGKDDEWGPSSAKEASRKPTRTSGRLKNQPRRKYVYDDDPLESSNDEQDIDEEEVDTTPGPFYKPEKVLAIRHSEGGKELIHPQYLTKIDGISYKHCKWMKEEDLINEFGAEVAVRRIKAFQRDRIKIEAQNLDMWEGDHFNPAYLEIDRIVAEDRVQLPVDASGSPIMRFPTFRTDTFNLIVQVPETSQYPPKFRSDGGETEQPKGVKFGEVLMYLVKWKELSYVHCTWEVHSDVADELKIAEYRRFNRPPVQYNTTRPAHPNPAQWYSKSKLYKGGNQLRFYQVAGINWLISCYLNSRNGILADEMGLGKTVQIVAFLDHLKQVEQVYGPHLIVVPLGTLQNWKREVERWTDMNAIVYHDSGRKAARRIMEAYEFYYPKMEKKAVKFNILITTYEIVQMDTSELAGIPWATLIVDEGHRLKNRHAKLLADLNQIRSARRKQPLTMLLTGTPIQNNSQELWALLNFVEPKTFASFEKFNEDFGDLKESHQIQRLQKAISPYVLRRMKEMVEKDIPPKEEIIIDIELTTLQKQYYRAIYERNAQFLRASASKSKGKNAVNLVNIEIQLRKCCNHPWLLTGVEDKETSEIPEEGDEYFQQLIAASGKTVLLDKLLEKLKKEGHRVLIFSQMRSMLDILERYLTFKSYKYERLDGGVTGNDRQRAIDRFCRPGSNRFVFLLSTRAGGVGLNLTQADTVIIFDIDWNPQQDMQAQARCHRIGQKKSVNIYRLVTRNTYESEMFARASKKLGLDHAVLHDIGRHSEKNLSGKEGKNGNRPEDIERILKLGVYGLLDDSDDKSKKFCESDINHILKTASR